MVLQSYPDRSATQLYREKTLLVTSVRPLFLKSGENYTWETTNPLTKRHYLLKDRLIQWEGRSARLEIAFDITETEAEKQSLKRLWTQNP